MDFKKASFFRKSYPTFQQPINYPFTKIFKKG